MSFHDQPCQCVQCKLWRAWERLEPDAQAALVIIAERLVRGRELHGSLDIARDGRSWWKELGEEMADGVVYGAFELLRLARKAEGK